MADSYITYWDSGWSLSASQSGPNITLTLSGTARYNNYNAGAVKNWSVRITYGSETETSSFQYTSDKFGNITFSNATTTFAIYSGNLGTSTEFTVVVSCNGTDAIDWLDHGIPHTTWNVLAPTLDWSSGANISMAQEGTQAHVILNGSLSIGNGFSGEIVYRVYCNGVEYHSWYVTPPSFNTPYVYKVQGESVIRGRTWYSSELSATFTVVVDFGNYVDYYAGSSDGWVQCKVYYYGGTGVGWIECKPYYYGGTGVGWIECSDGS